jgi:hypothetical protein
MAAKAISKNRPGIARKVDKIMPYFLAITEGFDIVVKEPQNHQRDNREFIL